MTAFDYVGALNKLVGSGASDFFVVVILFSFTISMNTATADGSRALYGISKDGMTIKELGRLNRFNVPGNAMSPRLLMVGPKEAPWKVPPPGAGVTNGTTTAVRAPVAWEYR